MPGDLRLNRRTGSMPTRESLHVALVFSLISQKTLYTKKK
jgi:hypothetical protein